MKRTDRPTDRQTDRQTDIAISRAPMELKIFFYLRRKGVEMEGEAAIGGSKGNETSEDIGGCR